MPHSPNTSCRVRIKWKNEKSLPLNLMATIFHFSTPIKCDGCKLPFFQKTGRGKAISENFFVTLQFRKKLQMTC